MSRLPKHTETEVQRAKLAADAATTIQELRQAQSILLPAVLGATLPQTAQALGVGRATVCRLQRAFRRSGSHSEATPKAGRGGRRHCWMTWDEEKEFLAPWLQQAIKGALVVVSPVRAALSQRLGQPVKASVAYRMLARHGWRKVAPDTRHPKSDPVVQEAWKKNFRKSWRPC